MWWRCFWMVLSVQPRKGMNWSCFQAASMLQVAFFGERTTMDHSDHSCLRLLEATHVLDFQRPSLNDWSHEYYQCALCTSIMQQHVILMPSNFAGNARITWIFFLVPTGTSKHRDCQPMLHPKRIRFSPIEVDVFAVCLSWKLLKHPSFAWLFYSILTFGMVHIFDILWVCDSRDHLPSILGSHCGMPGYALSSAATAFQGHCVLPETLAEVAATSSLKVPKKSRKSG